MRALCASVLAIEAIVVLLATSLAASNGSVGNTALAWIVGLMLMVLLILTAGVVTTRWGITVGWILQGVVLLSAFVVGWTMLVVGLLFVVLWAFAIRLGSRVDAAKAAQAGPGDPPH
jgi:hypothetical protein